MVFGNHSSPPSSWGELGTMEGVGRSNNDHLRNHWKRTTQPEQGLLGAERTVTQGRRKAHRATVLSEKVWPLGAYVRES